MSDSATPERAGGVVDASAAAEAAVHGPRGDASQARRGARRPARMLAEGMRSVAAHISWLTENADVEHCGAYAAYTAQELAELDAAALVLHHAVDFLSAVAGGGGGGEVA